MRWQIKRAFDMKTIGFVVVHMFIIVINIYTTDYTYVDVELVVKSNTTTVHEFSYQCACTTDLLSYKTTLLILLFILRALKFSIGTFEKYSHTFVWINFSYSYNGIHSLLVKKKNKET